MKLYNKKWQIFYQAWFPYDEELKQWLEQKRLEDYKPQVTIKPKKMRKPQPIRDNKEGIKKKGETPEPNTN